MSISYLIALGVIQLADNSICTVDGREIKPVREEQVVEQCKIIREKGLKNVCIIAQLSPAYRLC